MIEDAIRDAERRMGKSLDALATELTKIRTGRANASLLDHIKVEYYGSEAPLRSVANVVAEDARTLAVTAYEKDMTPILEKAILTSDLGITPDTAGVVIRIPMPALTEDRRRDLVKVVKGEAENTKVAIRNIRRDANGSLKVMVKEKMIAGDDERRGIDQIQKLTDKFVARVDVMVMEKEKELLEI